MTAGSGYDQVNTTGTVSLGGSTLNVSLGFMPNVGQTFTIINNDGVDAVSGIFSGLTQGATLPISGMLFQISYVGGDGNHTGSSSTGSFTIEKAPSTVTVTCPDSRTYTGGTIEPCSAKVTGKVCLQTLYP